MKILHVIGDSDYGGGSKIICQVAEASQRAGHRVEVLTTSPRFQQVLRDAGVAVLDRDWVRRRPDPWTDVRGVTGLTRHLRRGGYDLVHTHTTRGGMLGRLAAHRAGTPVIVHTAHGFAVAETDAGWKQRTYFALERLAARWCHYVVAVSGHHGRWAADYGVQPRIALRVIPNGVPDLPVVVPPPQPPAVAGDAPRLLHFGRIAGGKGIDVLLVALARVRAALPADARPHLWVAGDGPALDAERARAAALGLAGAVTWLGHRDDLPALLQAADVVVLPSLREGLSLALLEAMAAGRPIVASALGGNVEALDHGRCGALVPPDDADALASTMADLLAQPARAAELGVAARGRYLDVYRLERMLDDYLALYAEAAAAVGSAGASSARSAPR
ncbi:glycosyltransferase [Egicoccus sp. AB-alg2]|uniref:glycosyltransferase n=1 Tax=Egicoccus sp. AB-alg2 TaxID=3242693 RepID=UPI00359DE59F